jgi:hypothetical protein
VTGSKGQAASKHPASIWGSVRAGAGVAARRAEGVQGSEQKAEPHPRQKRIPHRGTSKAQGVRTPYSLGHLAPWAKGRRVRGKPGGPRRTPEPAGSRFFRCNSASIMDNAPRSPGARRPWIATSLLGLGRPTFVISWHPQKERCRIIFGDYLLLARLGR